MDEPIDELYFRWLYSRVAVLGVQQGSDTFWKLMRVLFKKEFVWFVPNDDNRVADGIDLRYEFTDSARLNLSLADPWYREGCSMLEMFIAMSRRLSFLGGGDVVDWFWQLLDNLDIEEYHDGRSNFEDIVDSILDRVIWRQYGPSGVGGLFPLNFPREDQREVELWKQLNSYLIERAI